MSTSQYLHQKKKDLNKYSTEKKTGEAVKKGLTNKQLTVLYEKTTDQKKLERLIGNRSDSFRLGEVRYPSFLETGPREGVRLYCEFYTQYKDQFGREYHIQKSPNVDGKGGELLFRIPKRIVHANRMGFTDHYVSRPIPGSTKLTLKPVQKDLFELQIMIDSDNTPEKYSKGPVGKASFRIV